MIDVTSLLQRAGKAVSDFNWWLSWTGIFVGCAVMAAGFVFFINPYNIVPGGVYGASIVLHNLFPSVQVGTFGYMFDVPLLILSALLLGAKLGARTTVAALSTPLIMNVMSSAVYPTREALERLDPSQLLGGCMDMTGHLMLTSIMGATLIGIGCGIVVRNQATTGGSDIVAMILQKYFHIRFSTAIMLVDAAVVGFGLVVIGFGVGSADGASQPSWHLSFYSLIAIFVTSRVLAYVINGAKDDKLLFVISDRKMVDLHRFILKDLDRTATLIKSSGLYTGAEKEMLFLVVSHKEVTSVKSKIKEADPRAFVVVTDAYDTFGEGWKQLPSSGELQPE
ncbi:MAG: YitT family protein [Prevotella sp.]|nr:YitT family protein [Prevotella sp.]